MRYVSNSPTETEKIAEELAKKLKKGDVVCLNGELGAGKTAFVKGLCRAFGVTDYVTSPTYTIINRYEAAIPIFHIDVYRISDVDEMYEIGFDDCLADGITIIEWSSLIEEILPKNRTEITIKRNLDVSDTCRIIEICE